MSEYSTTMIQCNHNTSAVFIYIFNTNVPLTDFISQYVRFTMLTLHYITHNQQHTFIIHSNWIVASTSHPVRWRVQFKLCVIMHCVHNGRAPAYLDNAVQPVNRRTVRPGLRSENSQNYYVPWVRTELGERAVSYTGPVIWNNLPVFIHAEPDITRFKNILKTYFLRLAFDLLG